MRFRNIYMHRAAIFCSSTSNSIAFELQNVAQIFWINFKDAFAAMHGYDKTVKYIFYHFIGKKVWN